MDLGPAVLPVRFELGANFPNPFNPSTSLRFSLPVAGQVRLDVHDIRGRHIRALVDEIREAGYHTVTWSGRDDSGATVASGAYLYRLQAGDFVSIKNMILVK